MPHKQTDKTDAVISDKQIASLPRYGSFVHRLWNLRWLGGTC